ncbi:hypothetical protein BDR04DRAFT_1087855 [Suillus decipiens]|nr:hypothetical protein BDR04DRAFT_1087855 [Suillus decipiens]
MVSPNRQGHIVATFPKESGYGRYRNMTPHRYNSSAPILHDESTPQSGLSRKGYNESEPRNDTRSCEHPEECLAPSTRNQQRHAEERTSVLLANASDG